MTARAIAGDVLIALGVAGVIVLAIAVRALILAVTRQAGHRGQREQEGDGISAECRARDHAGCEGCWCTCGHDTELPPERTREELGFTGELRGLPARGKDMYTDHDYLVPRTPPLDPARPVAVFSFADVITRQEAEAFRAQVQVTTRAERKATDTDVRASAAPAHPAASSRCNLCDKGCPGEPCDCPCHGSEPECPGGCHEFYGGQPCDCPCHDPAPQPAPARPAGNSWLDDLARASLSAAEAKFGPPPGQPGMCWCGEGPRGHLPDYVTRALHHDTTEATMLADSMVMQAVSDA